VATDLQPYHQKQAELGLEAGCVFCGTQVVISTQLRSQVLAELHNSPPGIVWMKGLPGLRCDGPAWQRLLRVVCRVVRHAKSCVINHPPSHYNLGPLARKESTLVQWMACLTWSW